MCVCVFTSKGGYAFQRETPLSHMKTKVYVTCICFCPIWLFWLFSFSRIFCSVSTVSSLIQLSLRTKLAIVFFCFVVQTPSTLPSVNILPLGQLSIINRILILILIRFYRKFGILYQALLCIEIHVQTQKIHEILRQKIDTACENQRKP